VELDPQAKRLGRQADPARLRNGEDPGSQNTSANRAMPCVRTFAAFVDHQIDISLRSAAMLGRHLVGPEESRDEIRRAIAS